MMTSSGGTVTGGSDQMNEHTDLSAGVGRGWSRVGFVLGIAASVAGNVAHAQPTLGAQLAAGFYPVALLVTVEVMARTVWPSGWSWLVVRFGGAGLVAVVAAIVSYVHIHGLLVGYGDQPVTAIIGPLGVDGLMVACGFALLAAGHVSEEPAAPEPCQCEQSGAQVDEEPLTLPEALARAFEAGTSQRAIAETLGVHHNKIGAIIRQARPPAEKVAEIHPELDQETA